MNDNCFKWDFTTKAKPPFCFLLSLSFTSVDNLIEFLFPTLKAKPAMQESLDLSLSCLKLICCNGFGTLFSSVLFKE